MTDKGSRDSDQPHSRHVEKPPEILMDAPIGFFMSTPNGKLLSVNQTLARMSGYNTPKELIDLITDTGSQFYTDPADMKAFHRLLEINGYVVDFECQLRHRNGSAYWTSTSARVIKDASGTIVHYQGFITDIDSSKKLEKSLRESERRFSKIFKASPTPQVISDIRTGKFIDVNDRWADMLGYTREALIGRTSDELGIWVDAEERKRIGARLQHQGSFKDEPVEFRTREGHSVMTLCSGVTIELLGREVMLLMIYDETERHQASQEQKRLQDQLNHSQKMESIGHLAGGVAHEFNNMLNVILGYSELLLEEIEPSEPLYNSLKEIHNAARRSADIARQLQAFARKQTIAPGVLDLNGTIESIMKMLRCLIREEIELAWFPGSDIWPVRMDPSQINQILTNLCLNACDAISENGRIVIETKKYSFTQSFCLNHPEYIPGDYVLLGISDDGCGMNKEIFSHLFEPFFTTKGEGAGSGLGLSTVYGMVKQNNGFINVSSETEKGTSVSIYLPRYEAEIISAKTKAETERKVPRGQGELVLVVEDESAILKLAVEMLENLEYRVLPAISPSVAMLLATKHLGKISLLITDVVMPEMSGRELADQLQASCPDLKTLFMSGYTSDVIAHRGVIDEVINFIPKPFSIRELAIKVHDVLQQAR